MSQASGQRLKGTGDVPDPQTDTRTAGGSSPGRAKILLLQRAELPPAPHHPPRTPIPPQVKPRRHGYLGVLRALAVVGGVEHLEAAHVAHVAVQVSAVDAVATLPHGGVRAELLPELLLISGRVALHLLDERDGDLHLHRLSCTTATTTTTTSRDVQTAGSGAGGGGVLGLTPATVRLARDELGGVGPVPGLRTRRRLAGFWIGGGGGGARRRHLGGGELFVLCWFAVVKPGEGQEKEPFNPFYLTRFILLYQMVKLILMFLL